METLAISDHSDKIMVEAEESTALVNAATNLKQVGGAANPKIMKGQVIQKNYILNDSSALKKKKKNENRKEAFNLGTEARDGSNMVIQMKTSFFEHVKAEFVKDILKHKDIEMVDNGLAAKASTENSGDGYVEYSMDIGFKFQEKSYVTKLTAYTTTCRIMFPAGW